MHIFISYAKQDSTDLALQIYNALSSHPNLTAWMDKSIRPGKGWASQIESELQKSDCVVVILSPDVNRDPNGQKGISFVINEIEYAQRIRKVIIPVMAQKVIPPVQIINLQYIELTKDLAGGLDELIVEIEKIKNALFPERYQTLQKRTQSELESPSNFLNNFYLFYSKKIYTAIVSALLIVLAVILLLLLLINRNPPIPNTFATLAFTRVNRNADWSPVARQINGVDMVLVPSGCFKMGGSDGDLNKKPMIDYCFNEPFWIDRFEVSRMMYEECVNDNNACEASLATESALSDSQPIANLNWSQAAAYCNWRGGRLPTESEWEYSGSGPENWVYPWGNEMIEENLAYQHRFGKTSVNSGNFPSGVSWVGAFNMSGNVMEWVQAAQSPVANQEVLVTADLSEELYIAKGGYFGSMSDFSVRISSSFEVGIQGVVPFVGIRCVRSFLDA